VFKQKIKHLLFEHKATVDDLYAESTAAMTLATEKHRVSELDLRRDKASLKAQIHHEQLSHEDLVKTLKKVGVGWQWRIIVFVPYSWHSTAPTRTPTRQTRLQSYVRQTLFPREVPRKEVGEDVHVAFQDADADTDADILARIVGVSFSLPQE